MMENKIFEKEEEEEVVGVPARRKSRLCASISGLIEEPDTHLFLSVCEQRSHHTYRHVGKRKKNQELN